MTEADQVGSREFDALKQFRSRLLRIYRDAGEPSTRRIAHGTSGGISHSTVHKVLRGEGLPSWGFVELVVEELGGNVEEFRRLWTFVRDQQAPLAVAPAEADDGGPSSVVLHSISQLDEVEGELQEQEEKQLRNERKAREGYLDAVESRAVVRDTISDLRSETTGKTGMQLRVLEERIVALELERNRLTKKIGELQLELRFAREERLLIYEHLQNVHARRAELYFEWARDEEHRREQTQGELGEERDRRRQFEGEWLRLRALDHGPDNEPTD